jgi:hypothetical protein
MAKDPRAPVPGRTENAPGTAQTPRLTAIGIVHKGGALHSLATLTIDGDRVVGRTETEPDSLTAQMGRAIVALRRLAE